MNAMVALIDARVRGKDRAREYLFRETVMYLSRVKENGGGKEVGRRKSKALRLASGFPSWCGLVKWSAAFTGVPGVMD